MKNLFFFTFVLINYLGFTQSPSTDPLYDTVWVDNFDSTALKTHKWQVHYDWGTFNNIDTVRCWINNELFYLSSINFNPLDTHNRRIDNGTCKLIARHEFNMGTVWTYPSPCNSPACAGQQYCLNPSDSSNSACFKPVQIPFRYSSAMLYSKVDFKYGYFETRFRFPAWVSSIANAFHPSFWMYNASSSVPWSEIDIFEIYGTTGRVTNAIHVDATVDNNAACTDDATLPSSNERIINLSQWHKIGCNWTPDSIVFYLDDTILRRNNVFYDDTNKYLLPMPLIIDNPVNLWFGCLGVDSLNAQFPFTMEIDYIKAWQPKLACDTSKIYCNINANTFKSKVYKNLTIGGGGCSTVFNNGKSSAIANDFVLLQEGFEVGSNMDMVIGIEPCWNGMRLIQRTNINPIMPPKNFSDIYMKNHGPND